MLTFFTDFIPTVSNSLPTRKKNRTGLIVGIIVGALVSFIAIFAVLCFFRRKKGAHTNEDEGKLKLCCITMSVVWLLDCVVF